MRCEECVRCEADDCGRLAYCLSDHPVSYPCPHGERLCENHNLTDCIDCRLEAERELHRSGNYDPRKDPFYNHNAPAPTDHIAVNGGYWWDGHFVEVKP